MISKKQFVKYINYIKQSLEKEDNIEKAIKKISKDSYAFVLIDEISHMIEMLCSCMDIEYDPGDMYGNDIEYFIYDLDFGKNWEPDSITEADGTSIDISTAEKLYDYLTAKN